LVIAGIGLGNTVLALPLIRILRQQAEKDQIDGLVIDRSSEILLDITGLVDHVHLYSGSWPKRLSILLRCRKKSYDLCLMTFPTLSLPVILLPLIVNAGYNIGHDIGPYNPFFRHFRALFDTLIPVKEGIHDTRQNINLLSPLVDPESADHSLPKVRIPAEADGRAEVFLEQHGLAGARPLFVFHAGSKAGASYKRWPIERYIELAARVKQSFKGAVVFTAGPDELGMMELLRERDLPVLHSDLATVMAMIGRSQCFVSNDSGIMHIASLLDVPMVTIWGGTDETRNGALSRRVVNVVHPDLHCRPCVRIVPEPECDLRECECLEGISVDRVISAIRFLITEQQG
jgi:heptosyltransferase-2